MLGRVDGVLSWNRLTRHATQGPSVVATALVRRIQSAGIEVQIVGVGAANGSTGPVVAVAGEIVQRSRVDVAGANQVVRANINHIKTIRSVAYILAAGKIGRVSNTSG